MTMPLSLTETLLTKIITHCELVYPHEGCGILLGHRENNLNQVVDVLLTENAWEEKASGNRYSISPEDLLDGELLAQERDLEIIGYFHSHPDYPARPSEFDCKQAWPCYSYLITSIIQGRSISTRSWQLRSDGSGFLEEPIIMQT